MEGREGENITKLMFLPLLKKFSLPREQSVQVKKSAIIKNRQNLNFPEKKNMQKNEDIYSHECTSWMVFNDLTKNDTFLLHKNRDAGARNILPLISREGAKENGSGSVIKILKIPKSKTSVWD